MDNDDTYSEYKFSKNNMFLDSTNPFEEGLKRLKAHDIVNAVLLFEAAVQKQPNHVEVRFQTKMSVSILHYLLCHFNERQKKCFFFLIKNDFCSFREIYILRFKNILFAVTQSNAFQRSDN